MEINYELIEELRERGKMRRIVEALLEQSYTLDDQRRYFPIPSSSLADAQSAYDDYKTSLIWD